VCATSWPRATNPPRASLERQAAIRYGGVILSESIQDNAENFTRFVLLVSQDSSNENELLKPQVNAKVRKLSLAMRLAHQPGALLAALRPFSEHGVNLLKIESRPIHGRPWEYQFFFGRANRGSGEVARGAARSACHDQFFSGAREVRSGRIGTQP